MAPGLPSAQKREKTGESRPFLQASKKVHFFRFSLLTVGGATAYIRLTNEGGAPLATKSLALETFKEICTAR
ncbi:MAG: hypothetical protein KDJ63_07980 [Nitratireductor sp.]|nr:hypothetical protein [Nitratireductor sp.]